LYEFTLPEATFTVDRLEPFKQKNKIGQQNALEKIGVSYNANITNRLTTAANKILNKDVFDRMNYGVAHSIPIGTSTKIFKFFTLSGGANYFENWVIKTIRKNWDPDTIYTNQIPQYGRIVTDTIQGFASNRYANANLTLSTKIFGLKQFKNSKIKAIRHVATPQVSMAYSPDFTKSKINQPYLKRYQTNTKGDSATYSIFDNTLFGGPPLNQNASINWRIENLFDMKVRNEKDTINGEKKYKLIEGLSASGGYNLIADSFQFTNVDVRFRTTLFDQVSIQLNTILDPYSRNALGTRTSQLQWQKNQRLLNFDNLNLAINTTLAPKSKNKTKTTTTTPQTGMATTQETNYYLNNTDQMIDYSLPYSLTIGYNLRYTKLYNPNAIKTNRIINTINLNGDLSLTPKWKIAFNTGYDFANRDFSFTTLDIYRDLHCWEMRLSLIPFGALRSFNFTINVKASVLQDLKLTRRRDWYDYR
jgi:hypothetical protein